MSRLLFLCSAMLLFPAAGFAGVDLTWNECAGTGMEANNQTFTCTGTVNQTYDLVVQFKSPMTLDAAAAVTAIIDLRTDQGAVPLSPFWRYDAGNCQRPSVGVEGVEMFDDIRFLPGCAGQDRDLWDGDGSGGSEGIGAYGADFPSSGRGRFVLLDARAMGVPLKGGLNYYAFHLTFNNRHRSDCAGCSQKAVLVINRLTIESTDGAPALEITAPDKKSICATINGGTLASSSVALAADPNPVAPGDPVKLTATVTPAASGTVNFFDGGNAIGSAALTGGTASLALTFFDLGARSLIVDYPGDDCFTGSSSAKTTLIVSNAPVITITDTMVTELDAGHSDLIFRVRLSSPSTEKVTVDFTTMDSTATLLDNDYQAQSGTLSFPPGSNQRLITVQVLGDNRREADEYLKVRLSNPSAPVTIADGLGVGKIVDEDTPTLSISNVSQSEGNTGKTVFNFTVTLSKGISEKVSVNYQTQDGTATLANNDYQPTSGTLSFPPSVRTKTIPVSVNGDLIDEASETFLVVLSSPVNATLGGQGIGTGTVMNDDAPPGITVTDTTVTEGDTGLTDMIFRVRLSIASGQKVTVDFTTTDSSATVADNDYLAQSGTLSFPPGSSQQLITVQVAGDNRREADEYLKVRLSNPSGAVTIADGLGVGKIVDGDTPTISIDNVGLDEGNTGKTAFNFTVTLSKGISEKVSVNYQTQDGTATLASNDYQPTSGTLSFAPKVRTLTIPVSVNGDSTLEAPETFRVVLSNPVNATLGGAGIGTGTIMNDDTGITVTDTTLTEGDTGLTDMIFQVRLSSARTQVVTVDFTTMDSSATVADNDYLAQSGTLSFPPGTTQQLITVKVVGDNRREADEYLKVRLANPSAPVTIVDGLGVGKIVDGDTPTISIDNVSLDEGNTGKTVFNFTVTLSKGISEKVSVNHQTQDGTATLASNDYQPTSGTLSFAPKVQSLTIPVSVNGDSINEPFETFRVVLSSPVNGTLGGTGIGTGTIENDDGIDIGIAAACVTGAFGACVDGYGLHYPVSVKFTVINKGNRPANDWSFDITLSDTLKSAPIPLKTQIPGPPIPAGGSVAVHWATGYEFDFTQMGIWQAEVAVRVKTPDRSDPTPDNNRAKVRFFVNDFQTGTLLALFEAEPVADGLELRWRFVDPHEVASVSLERGGSSSGPWAEVDAGVREEGGVMVAVDRDVSAGRTYWYRLTAQTRTGERLTFGPLQATAGAQITVFGLGRIIPNPSLGATRIEYAVARETAVRLSIVDVQGREVAVLSDAVMRPGAYQATWTGRNERGAVRAGLYFARYRAAGSEYVRRIVIAK